MESNRITGLEIAVIGMTGRFPGAKSIEAFWENLKEGVEALSFFSDEELEKMGVSSQLLDSPDYVKTHGGVLEGTDEFDAFFFNYTPMEAEQMAPQTRLFHECAWTALEDAGYDPDSYSGSIGLYPGISDVFHWRALSVLTSWTTQEMQLDELVMSYLIRRDFLSTLVAYKLNLKGPAFCMNCACSTSLLAIHLACQGLLSGDCDIALAGGIAVTVKNNRSYIYREGMIPSPDGHCRAFDANAGGTAGGSGIGIVVLKRLEEAIADRDNIHAVIKGSAINNDGKRKVGYTAPSVEAQAQVIQKALQISGVNPRDIDYIETHGTGTPLGDVTEFEALKLAFNSNKKHFCGLGSVKTNIGHLDTAAGVTGLIKVILALKHKKIPPSLNFQEPNPGIDFENSPFYVNTKLKEWKNNGRPLRAGVSSFGIGGTNVHLVAEEAPAAQRDPHYQSQRKYKLLLLSAKTQTALDHMTRNLTRYLKNNPHIHLEDTAYTLQVGRKHFQHRRKLTCTGAADAADALSSSDSRKIQTHVAKQERKKPVFMFPGLGAQYVNMGLGLYQTEPVFRKEMDKCFHILQQISGTQLKDIFYPIGNSEEAENLMKQTEIAQYVIFTLEYSLARLLMAWGLNPHAMIGYSFGEYVCACISGVFSLEDALRLLVARGILLRELPPGMMLNIPLPASEVQPMLSSQLSIGIDNGSTCVVSGATAAVRSLEKQLKQEKIMCMPLDSTHAIHSQMMDPVLKRFEQQITTIPLNSPQIPYISGVTGTWIRVEDATSPLYWVKQLRERVRFSQGLGNLVNEPGALFLEIGPGHDISALVSRQLDPESGQHVINMVRHPRKEAADDYYLLDKIGLLWLYGLEIDWNRYYGEEKPYRVSLPTYPFESRRYWKLIEGYLAGKYTLNAGPGIPGKKQELPEWFYIPSWKRREILTPKEEMPHENLAWLIFVDQGGLGDGLADYLKKGHRVITVKAGSQYSKQSHSQYTISPGQYADYEILLKELHAAGETPTRIIHLWGITHKNQKSGREDPRDFIEKSLETGFFSLLYLGRALGRDPNYTKMIEINVLTDNMQEVTDSELLYPGKAAVLGPCRVISQEYPHITCRSIDLVQPGTNKWQDPRLIRQVAQEVTVPPDDMVVAYRGNHRWIQIFDNVRLEKQEKPSLLREKGVYLLAGGLGEIGFTLAESLIKNLGARLILTGRSQLPPKEMWDQYLIIYNEDDKQSQHIRKLQRLEKLGGEVFYYNADLSDKNQMQEAVKKGEEQLGPINGVIHCAGLIEGETFSPVENITVSQCLQQFNGKIFGTLVLAELLKDKELDFCLLISSISVVLGGLGFAAYAAGNHFMDALAIKHSREKNQCWIIVNWDGTNKEQTEAAFMRIFSCGSIKQVVFSTGGELEERIARWVKLEDIKNKDKAGKKDAASLQERPELSNPYEPPANHTERQLAEIWQNFFGIEKIGVTDNLFELGGDSLKAINIISIIHKELNVTIPIRVFFDNSTIQGVAKYLIEAEKEEYVPIKPGEKKEYHVLSSAQRRMYILQQKDLNSLGYNSPLAEILEIGIDKKRLEQTFKRLIRRHESLRTSMIVVGNEPVQQIHETVDFAIEYYTIHRDKPDIQQVVKNFIRPFDLSQPPLLRVALIERGENHPVLLVDVHHIVTDGVSHEILVKEFTFLYKEEEQELPPLKLQYKDYSEWQNTNLQRQHIKRQEEYWLKRYSGDIPVINLPTDFKRPAIQSFEGKRFGFKIGKEQTTALQAICSKEGTTMFMLLLAIYNVFLAKICGQEDIVVGSVISGRNHADLEKIIGIFVNVLALRNFPTGEKTFKEFLKDVRDTTISDYQNQNYEFENLVESVAAHKDPGRHPIYGVGFTFQNYKPESNEIPTPKVNVNQSGIFEKIFNALAIKKDDSKIDFNLYGYEIGEQLFFRIQYATRLFKKETIERFMKYFQKIVANVIDNPNIKLKNIEILSKNEKIKISSEIKQSRQDFQVEFDI